MREWFYECLVVLSYSGRTQLALVATLVVPILIQLLGRWLTADFALTGVFAPLTDVFRTAFMDRYNGLSLAAFAAFAVAAYRAWQRDRKRLLEL